MMTVAFVFLSYVAVASSADPNLKDYIGLDVNNKKAKVSLGGDVHLWYVQVQAGTLGKFELLWGKEMKLK